MKRLPPPDLGQFLHIIAVDPGIEDSTMMATYVREDGRLKLVSIKPLSKRDEEQTS